MKKILRNNKGFSLVELLIALLIMAVIAAAAVTLFGGVLNSSKGGADRETASSIERAVQTYMNASNDQKCDMLTCGTTSSSAMMIARLTSLMSISEGTATTKKTIIFTPETGNSEFLDGSTPGAKTLTDVVITNASEIPNVQIGPYLDYKKAIRPQAKGMLGWDITVDSTYQRVTVNATSGAIALLKVN